MAAFTGRRGSSTRLKVLLGIFVLVLVGAAVYLYVLPGRDVRARLARGELTEADAAALRADPETWVSLLGQAMHDRAEAGDAQVTQALSAFMLEGVESLDDPDQRASYGQMAAWVHEPAVSAAPMASSLGSWLTRLGAGTEVRLRVACDAFGAMVQAGHPPDLAPVLFRTVVAAVDHDPGLRGVAEAHCHEVLIQAFRQIDASATGNPPVAELQGLVGIVGPGVLTQLGTDPDTLSLRTRYALAVVVRPLVEGGNSDGSGEASDSPLEDFWWNTLLPSLSQTLNDTPAASPRLWEAVDDRGTPLGEAALAIAREAMAPLQAFGIADRLLEGVPADSHASLDALQSLARQAESAAEAYVAAQLAPALASCRAAAGAETGAAIRVHPDNGISASTRLADPLRACLDAALGAVTLVGQDALVRPLELTVPFGPPTPVP